MAEGVPLRPLTGHAEFDALIAAFSDMSDVTEQEAAREEIWQRFGVDGAVFISDMANFSVTSRKLGVCHFLKLIHRTRQTVAPIVVAHDGLMLKADADNCYAYFPHARNAIEASFEINAALVRSNKNYPLDEQIQLSVGIDYGRVLLIGDMDFYGDPVNTASKLGEDLAVRAETLVTDRAIEEASYDVPVTAERMVARISDIEISYVRLPMMEPAGE